jgi:hypothetical protein
MTAVESHDKADLATITPTKYTAEADNVAKLLETNSQDAAQRLILDGHLSPHELHNFLAQVKADYDKDRAKNPSLPELSIAEDKDGFKVSLKKDGDKDAATVVEKKYDAAAKAADKPIPQTGELLGLSKEQTQQILDIQKAEKAKGGKSHLFGDIAVSLGFATPEQVNAALDKQDHMKAARLADDMSHSMPLGHKEGYFQLLKRTHPELTDSEASQLAHAMKKLNHNQINLHEGSQLATLNKADEKKLEDQAYASIHQKTGTVHAKFKQPLSEIPIS